MKGKLSEGAFIRQICYKEERTSSILQVKKCYDEISKKLYDILKRVRIATIGLRLTKILKLNSRHDFLSRYFILRLSRVP